MNDFVRFAVIVMILLFLLAGCARPTAESLIVKVEESSLSKTTQEDAIAFYEQNKDRLQMLADYLLDNESLFESRPIALTAEYNTDRIKDNGVHAFAEMVLRNETITVIWSENNRPDLGFFVKFIIGGELDVYEQGLLYTSDSHVAQTDVTVYNDVKRYEPLGDGWFYFFHHVDGVKDADRYRKAIWDRMDEKTRKKIRTDWNDALVTLKDWNGKLVVSVCFRTEQDGLLGPITTYLDPLTAEIAGGELRF